jgi:serine/threonine protein kinase
VSTPGATDLNPEEGWDCKQFESEMDLLCAVSPPSICRLLAFSTDGPQRCLVLELYEGGTLDSRLACRVRDRFAKTAGDELSAVPLTWQQRVKLAHGIARAVGHLHSLSPPMLHRDLKSANVLLDAGGNAKVSDFGM